MSIINPYQSESFNNWTIKSKDCFRDLTIKKVVCGIIIAINIAGIAALLTYVALYQPIETKVLAFAPFIGGALTGIALLLKRKEAGEKGLSYLGKQHRRLLRPAYLVAEVLTAACFFPMVCVLRLIDWTDYSDPFKAHRLTHKLREGNLEDVIRSCNGREKKLEKYGLLKEGDADRMIAIRDQLLPVIQDVDFCKAMKVPDDTLLDTFYQKHPEIKQNWESIKETIPEIPKSAPPPERGLNRRVRVALKEHLGINTFPFRCPHTPAPIDLPAVT